MEPTTACLLGDSPPGRIICGLFPTQEHTHHCCGYSKSAPTNIRECRVSVHSDVGIGELHRGSATMLLVAYPEDFIPQWLPGISESRPCRVCSRSVSNGPTYFIRIKGDKFYHGTTGSTTSNFLTSTSSGSDQTSIQHSPQLYSTSSKIRSTFNGTS